MADCNCEDQTLIGESLELNRCQTVSIDAGAKEYIPMESTGSSIFSVGSTAWVIIKKLGDKSTQDTETIKSDVTSILNTKLANVATKSDVTTATNTITGAVSSATSTITSAISSAKESIEGKIDAIDTYEELSSEDWEEVFA